MPTLTLVPERLPAQEPVRDAARAAGATRPGHTVFATGGQRLAAAFEDCETFPALRRSRDAMLYAARNPTTGRSTLIAVIETDPALVIAVLRTAGSDAAAPKPVSVVEAVATLSIAEVEEVANAVPVFDFFEQARPWSDTAERFRVHARATQAAAAYLRLALGYGPRPDLNAAALLHDIGKLALLRAYDRYDLIWNARASADHGVALEHAELGIDHAVVGGVLARRLGLAVPLARTIELHHNEEAMGDPAIIRLADMLAHYATGGPVQAGAVSAAAVKVGLSMEDLRGALDELPGGARAELPGATQSPLTLRETEMVQQLASGKRYKEIATDSDVALSTVRTHLYNSYRKLGVADRAQAVLLATENGWL